jgi:hypothetical protein
MKYLALMALFLVAGAAFAQDVLPAPATDTAVLVGWVNGHLQGMPHLLVTLGTFMGLLRGATAVLSKGAGLLETASRAIPDPRIKAAAQFLASLAAGGAWVTGIFSAGPLKAAPKPSFARPTA